MSISKIILAGDVKVGDQLAEQDGFLWDVAEITAKTEKTITIRLYADFSSNSEHWTLKPDGAPGGVLKTFSIGESLVCIPAVVKDKKES